MSDISDHTLEVRYRPNAKILDFRGSWAEAISAHMKLSEWTILENRVDIYDKNTKERAFVGFRNAGYVAVDVPTRNYFLDKTSKYLKYLFSLEGFGKSLVVERLGLRSTFCRPFAGEFSELLEKYTSNYLSLTPKAKELLKAKLLDIGGPLNFEDEYGKFNTVSGPMYQGQIGQFFDRKEGLPAVGLFFDIDYSVSPNAVLAEKEVLKKIEQFANSAWDRFETVSKLILGDA
jgi:hypothetical protein